MSGAPGRRHLAAVLLAAAAITTGACLRAARADEGLLADRIDTSWLKRPIGRIDGIGRAHRAATTPSPEAQAFYDQGLALLHSYRWIDAARSFGQALRHDPKLALAELGLARVLLQLRHAEAARARVERGASLASRASRYERALIQAGRIRLEAALAPPNERERLGAAYRRALDRALEIAPWDVDTILLRGLAEEPGVRGRGQRGGERGLPYFEKALSLEPNHPGAHHYLAHALENLGRYREAAKHALAYARIAHAVGHAQHMAGHLLPRLGRWQEAAARFERAAALERARLEADALPERADWHLLHDLALLGLVYDELGRPERARATLERAFRTESPSPTMQVAWAIYPEYLLARGQPKLALRAAEDLARRGSPLLGIVAEALAGEARLELGDEAGARASEGKARRLAAALRARLATEPLAAGAAELAEEPVAFLAVRLAMRGGADGPARARAAARSLSRRRSFDAWARNTLRLERLATDARALGDEALAREIEARRLALRGPGPSAATPASSTTPSTSPAARAAKTSEGAGGPPRGTSGAEAAPTPAASRRAGHDWNDGAIAWRSYAAGLREARREGKPICLVLYTDWCPHCRNYARVFHDPKVVRAARDLVMIRLDRDRRPALSRRYAPDGDYVPRTFFLSPEGHLARSIHAARDTYLYFFDEHRPGPLLAAMRLALERLARPPVAPARSGTPDRSERGGKERGAASPP